MHISLALLGIVAASVPKLDVPEPPEWEDVEHPDFEAYPVEAGELQNNAVFEQFVGSPNEIFERWQVSTALRDGEEPYVGEWAIEEPTKIAGFNGDQGLVLKSEKTVAAIARKFNTPIDATSGNDPLVIQYEVKLQQPLRCGGAYVKLLPSTKEANWSEFSNQTPYLVMFGPDKCGGTDKVHFILTHNGVEHHFKRPPRSSSRGLLSTLYSLVIFPDQRFEIRFDGAVKAYGSLLDSDLFDPPLSVPAKILDVNDKKPASWIDDEYIPDPSQTEKPEDWDETQEHLIPDPEAVKPEKWMEDEPLFIEDPNATKPELWDDEEDGEWHAPQILNPKCENLDAEKGEGCGKWLAPLIRNPKFKGKWAQPLIPNPDYEGEWTPRMIPNPEFDPKATPGKLDSDIGGIGFELLTVQGNILFDNIYIGNSVRDAENIGNATWSPKYLIERVSQTRAQDAYQKHAEESRKQQDDGQSLLEKYRAELEDFSLAPLDYIVDMYHAFIDAFRQNKIDAIKEFPVTAFLALVGFHIVTMVLFGLASVVRTLFKPARTQPRRSQSQPSVEAPLTERKE